MKKFRIVYITNETVGIQIDDQEYYYHLNVNDVVSEELVRSKSWIK